MPPQPHLLRRLSLDVATADLGTALGVRARVEDMARTLLPPILDRVFDRLSPPDLHVRLDRLDLRLGTIAADRLEADVPVALETALTQALTDAIEAARAAPSSTGLATPEPDARLDRFITYLATGSAPSRLGGDILTEWRFLIAEAPAELIARLRRLGGDRRAVERLVLQLGDAHLPGLLRLLADADADMILHYVQDLIALRRDALLADEPLPPRTWWVLTVTYLLRDAGSQFNRRSFVVFLLERIAAAEGFDYSSLLDALRRALVLTRRSQPLGGSLLAVLQSLFAVLPTGPPPNEPTDDNDAFARADAGDIGPLLDLLRRALGDLPAMEALASRLTEAVFALVLRHLDPANAASMLAYLGELRMVHRDRALVGMPDAGFESLTRALVLVYVMREPGSVFNSRSWLSRLLRGIAAARGIAYTALLSALADGLARLRYRLPAAASLPAVVAVLIAEQPLSDVGNATAPEQPIEPLLLRLYDAADDPPALEHLVATLSPAMFGRVVTHLEPTNAPVILSYVDALNTAHRRARIVAMPQAAFARLVQRLTLRYLLREPGSAFNRRSWLRRLLSGIAAAEDVPYAALLDSLSAALALVRAILPSASSLPGMVSELLRDRADNAGLAADGPDHAIARAEAFLRTGEPAGDGAILLRVAVRDGVSFAALLRRLARSMPSGIDRLADRLLDWLLAEEVAASLAPDLSVDLPDSAAAWRRTFRALLARETLPPATGAGLHLDRLAALRHWLDHGVLPQWTPAGLGAKALADLSVFDLCALFAGTDMERASVRLRRVMDDLGETAGSALLARLAPAVFTADGTLATILRNAEPGARGDIRLRAVAAAVTDATLDPAWLARPVPHVRPSQGVQYTEPPQPEDRTEVLAWLEGTGHLLPARQIRLLASLANAGDPALDAALRTGLARPTARDRWVQALPQEVLGHLLQRIVPTRARLLLAAMAVLTAAWRQAESTASTRLAWPWSQLLALLAESSSHPPRRLVARLAEALAPAGAEAQARLLQQARAIAQSAGLAGIVPAFRPPDIQPGPPPAPPVVPAPRIEPDTAHYVGNAGLILFAPFLPTLLTRLGLLSQVSGKQRIAGLEAASRAVHLLQFLVDQRCDRPEHTLLLNKLLCGISWAEPILPMIEPTEAEAGLCSEVTRALVGNWTAVRNAAPEGVRETFLQRDGRLMHGADCWDLQVQRKTVDVLTDLIPWNRSIIYHPWMAEAVYVTW